MMKISIKEVKEALEVFKDLKYHIVYDKGLKCLCYSAQFIKARHNLIEYIKEKLDEESKEMRDFK